MNRVDLPQYIEANMTGMGGTNVTTKLVQIRIPRIWLCHR